MVSEAKYRHEFKYFINAWDRELLSRRLGVVMKRDPHTTSSARSTSTTFPTRRILKR